MENDSFGLPSWANLPKTLRSCRLKTLSDGKLSFPMYRTAMVKNFSRLHHNAVRHVFLIFGLGAIFFVTSGLLLEGYGVARASVNGEGYDQFFPSAAGRPLILLPTYLAGQISGVSPIGIFLVNILLAAIRYFAILRIDIKNNFLRFLALTIGVLLPPWFGVSNERFSGGVLAATLVILAWTDWLLKGKASFRTAFIFFLAALCYPPIILCAPLAAIALAASGMLTDRLSFAKSFTSFIPLCYGPGIYLIYLFAIKDMVSDSYEASFQADNISTNFLKLFFNFYRFNTLGILIVFTSMTYIVWVLNSNKMRKIISSIICLNVFMLSSVVYTQSGLHVNDPDRILLPFSVTFLLFLLARFMKKLEFVPTIKVKTITVLIIIIWVALFSNYWVTIRNTHQQLIGAINTKLEVESGSHSLLVVDQSGRLGDVNTFYNDTLFEALKIENVDLEKATICTQVGVRRLHYIAARFPLSTTPDCGIVTGASKELVMIVTSLNPLKYSWFDR